MKETQEELTYHVPVLLKESVDGMNICPNGTYVDVTFGGGGHSREILSRLEKDGRLLGFDRTRMPNETLSMTRASFSCEAISATCTTFYTITI